VRSPTWAEYLAEATAYLARLRRCADLGSAPPLPPARPDGDMPADREFEARRLAHEYDQLSEQVTTRLTELVRRSGSMTRPRPSPPPAFYVDTPA
jgi:hypothetical protein